MLEKTTLVLYFSLVIFEVFTVTAKGAYAQAAYPEVIDPPRARGNSIWNDPRKSALIYIEAGIDVGTGFLVSKNHALTAKHTVCDKATDQPKSDVRLFVGGGAQHKKPLDVICVPNLDVAILHLTPVTASRSFLHAGAVEDLNLDPSNFVSIYGFGGGEREGYHNEGRATLSHTNNYLLQISVENRAGDSGAPVVDCRGRVVAVYIGGTASEADAVPLGYLDISGPNLKLAEVELPPPLTKTNAGAFQGCQLSSELASGLDRALWGTVWIKHARTGSGPERTPATNSDIEVSIDDHGDFTAQGNVIDTLGTYRLPLDSTVNLQTLQVTARHMVDGGDDPALIPAAVTLQLGLADLASPHDLDLFEPNRFVSDRKRRGDNQLIAILNNGSLPSCMKSPGGSVNDYVDCADEPDSIAGMKRFGIDFNQIISYYEDAYKYARDFDIASLIVSKILEVQTLTGNPCRAVRSALPFIKTFNQIGPALAARVIDDLSGCLYSNIKRHNSEQIGQRAIGKTLQEEVLTHLIDVLALFNVSDAYRKALDPDRARILRVRLESQLQRASLLISSMTQAA